MPKLPGVNHLRAVRALEKAGFQIDRQSKHIFMSNGSVKVVMHSISTGRSSWRTIPV